ncbi:protein translocase subunit SecD [Rhodothermus profundi]|uniref:Protein translocase subunit SecD n=1 Tax=Rhodothermus profundi TaxID=633813 RepID=A0A1M6SCQ5_9BACT|nr:protein translocase subunit SecD [Rhodothermus profundi]SHK42523.1 preprotein translocase subunit SecD [Rhodothermus profundi]
MKRNGFKIGITLALLLLCGYYLYPTVRYALLQRKLNRMSEEERAAFMEANYGTIQSLREKALKLGLDLQGGMHVTLEVRVDALIRELATDVDETFEEVLAAARERARFGGVSLIDAFVEEFERRDPNARLSRYFRNPDAGITRRSSNEEVAAYLRQQVEEAVDRAIEIIRDRVDRYGVTEPSIQKQGTRRIVVELPGVDDPERVRRLLRGTARLEFRLMAEPQLLQAALQEIIAYYEPDTTAQADTLAAADTSLAALLGEQSVPERPHNPLLAVMQPVGQGVIFGIVAGPDTAKVNRLLRDPEVRSLLPPGIELLYTANPIGTDEQGRPLYYLLGVRKEVELTGEVITDARVEFDELNRPQVSMTMNSEGARIWARLTGANVGKHIAIVLDNVVYSYPVVNERIPSGRSSITGLDSREEAQDIVTVLKSGALPAPVEIIEERTVGPSLGEASIRAGLRSVLTGLLLVALFMIFYYRTGGMIADLALVLNIIFILGILAAFKATLTLPGIAGIVLTIGMAVDANVLIFERIREEQATGKTLRAAIDLGYSKAFSAIFDANITTFFTGAILYSFGVGPIQGFAVTLMAGIAASLFSAIVITRIIFDYLVLERKLMVSVG